jgi:ABC-type branched-subunit amino acid transport system ATPase component
MSTHDLVVRGLCVNYGGVSAVRSVDLGVATGEAVGIIGAKVRTSDELRHNADVRRIYLGL